MTLGTRDEHLQPHFARAVAARVGPAADELMVFLSTVVADEIVTDLRANGQIAVAITNMDNLAARQVKGTLVRIVDGDETDAPYIRAASERATAALSAMCGPDVGAALGRLPQRPILAITMKIDAVFDQTPRAGAGERIA